MSQPLRRVFGYLTTSSHKINEIKKSFDPYGIEIVKLNPDDDWITYLRSSTPKFRVMGVISEKTRLVKPGTEQPAKCQQLEPVEHKSTLTLRQWIDNDMKITHFEETTLGYIDLLRKTEGSQIYHWDDVFVVNSSHLTYHQINQLGHKVSSRDRNVSKLIEMMVHYSKPIDLFHNPQKYTCPVDFTQDPNNYLSEIPEFHTEFMKQIGLSNIITCSLNSGFFFKSVKTRPQRLYWCPGLNAGIPWTPKPKDRHHELTFQFHDLSHFNIPDLVFDGNNSEFHRLVYISYRLMSEAITLVLADMIFVYTLFKSGINYQTVNQRKIYPVFQAIEQAQGDLYDNFEKYVYRILEGSVEHCFYGESQVWEKLMGNSETSKTVIEQFAEKYDAYFMEDFKWTGHNWDSMASSSQSFEEWWAQVESFRGLGINLQLESVTEFIQAGNLRSDMNRRELLTQIFQNIYSKYIQPLFNGKEMEIMSLEQRRHNTFVRYMIGQSHVFFRFKYHPEAEIYFRNIQSTLQSTKICNLDLIQNVRSYYNSFLEKLETSGMITPDQRINWEQTCPLFSPMIIDYDHSKESSIKNFVDQILGKISERN